MIYMIIEYEFWCVTVVFNLIVGIVNHESCFVVHYNKQNMTACMDIQVKKSTTKNHFLYIRLSS